MSSLRERFQAARRESLALGEHTVTIRRPTPWDIVAQQAAERPANVEWASSFVVDWTLQESDLIPGGNPEPAPFDAQLFEAWIKEHPKHWMPLVNGVIEAYTKHHEASDERGNV